MAIVKTHNAQGGSDARYDLSRMTPEERSRFDGDGRPLGADNPGQWEWTQGLPGAREMNAEGGGGGAGGAGGGVPGAAVWGQMVANGLAEYKKALARLNQNRQSTMTQYGYAADIDPETGTMKNMRVDSANPFGLYQGRRRNNAQQYMSLRDAASERRLGSRGLGAQGISDARWEWGAADTAMAQALSQTISGYDETQQGAWQAYQNLKFQAELEAARAAAAAASYGNWGDPGGSYDDNAGLNPHYQGVTQAGATEGDPNARPQDLVYRPTYQVNPTVTQKKKAAQQQAPTYASILAQRAQAMARAYR